MNKGLDALRTLKNGYMDNEKVVITRKAFDNQVAIIEKELKDKEKQDKVLEILLNKIIEDKDYFLLVAKNCDLTKDEINIVLERLEK